MSSEKSIENNERKYGSVKRFFDADFGFLFCEDIPADVFFHLDNWRSGDRPVIGQKVTFSLGPGRKEGQPPQAVLIRPIVSTGLNALSKGIEPTDVTVEIGASKAGV